MKKFKKVDWYLSDRWRRIINIYRCKQCGKEESDFKRKKPQIEKEHVCS